MFRKEKRKISEGKKAFQRGSPSSAVPMGLKLAEAKMVRNCIPTNISFQYSDFWQTCNILTTPPPPPPFNDQIWLVICLQTYLTILYVLHAYPVFHSSDAKPWWYCHFIIIIYTHITVRYKAIQQVSYKPVQTSHSQALPLSMPLALESFALSH